MPSIITLSGMLGSGKSTVGKLVAKELGFDFYSTGNAQRQIAQEMGLSTLELNKLSMRDKSIDDRIDGVLKKLHTGDKDLVVDSRLAFFFVPASFKIKLNIDTKEAGRRVLADTTRQSERAYANIDEAVAALVHRRVLEVERFITLYNVNIDNDDNFDYVIDTTYKSPQEVATQIITQYNKHLKRQMQS